MPAFLARRWRKGKKTLLPAHNGKNISAIPDEKLLVLRSGYGGNALWQKMPGAALGSAIARPKAGWRAHDHPAADQSEGRQYHITAPSIGLRQNKPGHDPTDHPRLESECIGDDIAWMKIARTDTAGN